MFWSGEIIFNERELKPPRSKRDGVKERWKRDGERDGVKSLLLTIE